MTGDFDTRYCNFPGGLWNPYPSFTPMLPWFIPITPVQPQAVYICEGCNSAINHPIYCCVQGKFGWYCSIPCAQGNKTHGFTITYSTGTDLK